jgi:hypothetical protein
MAFLTQNKAKFCKNLIITLVFEKNVNFFTENWEKSQKIVIKTSTPDEFVKKVAINVAQPIFFSKNNMYVTFTEEKGCPKICAKYVIENNWRVKTIAPWAKIRPIWSLWLSVTKTTLFFVSLEFFLQKRHFAPFVVVNARVARFFFGGTTYQNEKKIYRMAIKYTEWQEKIPNGH